VAQLQQIWGSILLQNKSILGQHYIKAHVRLATKALQSVAQLYRTTNLPKQLSIFNRQITVKIDENYRWFLPRKLYVRLIKS